MILIIIIMYSQRPCHKCHKSTSGGPLSRPRLSILALWAHPGPVILNDLQGDGSECDSGSLRGTILVVRDHYGEPFWRTGNPLSRPGASILAPWCFFGWASWGRRRPEVSGPPRSPLKIQPKGPRVRNWAPQVPPRTPNWSPREEKGTSKQPHNWSSQQADQLYSTGIYIYIYIYQYIYIYIYVYMYLYYIHIY